jgi:hypothetical protein
MILYLLAIIMIILSHNLCSHDPSTPCYVHPALSRVKAVISAFESPSF